MLPIYERLKMDKRLLCLMVSMAAGINYLPWTGPTLRSSAVIHIPTTEIFMPIVIPQLVGIVFMLPVAYLLGKREARRLGLVNGTAVEILSSGSQGRRKGIATSQDVLVQRRAGTGGHGHHDQRKVDPAPMFMVGVILAMVFNYPHVDQQKARVDAHARAALMMASILLAAGAFVGIMKGTGMITAMAKVGVS